MIGYLIIAGIGYGIAFWISSRGLAWWISVVGFFLALIIGWLGGGLIVAGGLSLISPEAAKDVIVTLFGRGFWWAAVGAGFGVFRARFKQQNTVPKSPVDETRSELPKQKGQSREETLRVTMPSKQPNAPIQTSSTYQAPGHEVSRPITGKSVQESAVQTQTFPPMPLNESTEEDFWATAMTEVETGPRRPGIWAKAFAECDGDETKAKVAYLKARVQQLTDAARALQAQKEAERREEAAKVEVEAFARKQALEEATLQFARNDTKLSKDQLNLIVQYADRQYLIKAGNSITGNTLLHVCAERAMVEEVNALLLAGADPSRPNNAGSRPGSLTTNSLILQLCNGLKVSQERLKVMINPPMGFCPNCDDVIPAEVQTCPTCQAMVGPSSSWQVRCLDEVQMVSELKSFYLEKRPTLNQVKYLVAASTRDSTLVSLADPHKYKATLLHWCAHYGLIEQAHVLLAHGANAKAKNSQGRLPYEWCENKELSQVLSRAAELTAAPHAGLLEAVINGNWSSAKTLLDDGVKPTGCDEEDRSLLDHARARNDTLMISLLESYGST